jgi:subtilisin family serine protease
MLEESLNFAARNGVLVIASAGNQGTLGSSAITRHPWVIPVTAYGLRGWPMSQANVGRSVGMRGLGAPGEAIESLAVGGGMATLAGTSFAASFVTGAAALLWSEFRSASAAEVRAALVEGPRRTVVPPLLKASAAYEALARVRRRRD